MKKKLKELVLHMWVHDGYPQNGYLYMTTDQKKLFCRVIGASYGSLGPVFEGIVDQGRAE